MGIINVEYLLTPSGILKIIEIVMVSIAFGVFRGVPVAFAYDDANYFGGGVLIACLIITPLILTCYLMNKMEIQRTILEVALNSVFFLFLFSVSIKAFVYWTPMAYGYKRQSGLSLACFTLFSSMAYLCDIPFSVKNFLDEK